MFDIARTVEQVSWYLNKDIIQVLTERVAENGLKTNIDGIHLPGKDYYRQQLVDEMIKHGLNPADWGYERFVRENDHES